jgi:signal peptidase I
MADNIVTGRKYRIKAAENIWDLISFWTKSIDVEMDDGTTLQDSFSGLKTSSDAQGVILEQLADDNAAVVDGAPGYSDTKKYEKGDIVTYNGSQYYCKTDITNPESWNSSHWELITGSLPFKFGIDAEGNYGYIKAGADSVTPFSNSKSFYMGSVNGSGTFYLRDYGIKESKWSDLTVNNFIVGAGSASVNSGWYYTEGFEGVGAGLGVSKSFDAHAGTLSVSSTLSISRGSDTNRTYPTVYVTFVDNE